MSGVWPALNYSAWSATCDTLHAHTQVLGKLAVSLAPPEPELQHAALRLTARGWETLPLPAPDRSGALGRGEDDAVGARDAELAAAGVDRGGVGGGHGLVLLRGDRAPCSDS